MHLAMTSLVLSISNKKTTGVVANNLTNELIIWQKSMKQVTKTQCESWWDIRFEGNSGVSKESRKSMKQVTKNILNAKVSGIL